MGDSKKKFLGPLLIRSDLPRKKEENFPWKFGQDIQVYLYLTSSKGKMNEWLMRWNVYTVSSVRKVLVKGVVLLDIFENCTVSTIWDETNVDTAVVVWIDNCKHKNR